MAAKKIKVELTSKQIDALVGACTDADSYDVDCFPGDDRLRERPIRDRALTALLRARREQTGG